MHDGPALTTMRHELSNTFIPTLRENAVVTAITKSLAAINGLNSVSGEVVDDSGRQGIWPLPHNNNSLIHGCYERDIAAGWRLGGEAMGWRLCHVSVHQTLWI